MGKLIFNYGCMNSSKTIKLLTTAFELEARNQKVLYFKPALDSRFEKSIIKSRVEGIQERECILIKHDDNLLTICYDLIYKTLCEIKTTIYILIDEAQFLQPKQVDELSKLCDNNNIKIICYGLRTDFKTKLFPGSARLFELSDEINEIESFCYCNNKNIINVRVDKIGRIITYGEQIEIGSEEKYITLCRKCYNDKLFKQKKLNKI